MLEGQVEAIRQKYGRTKCNLSFQISSLLNYLVNTFVEFKFHHVRVVGSVGSVESRIHHRATHAHIF
jgi:hypothetical protein